MQGSNFATRGVNGRAARPAPAAAAAAATVEFQSLEARTLLSVSQDEQGWTNFTRAADARTIYVSSSAGNDRNGGLTSARPVQSLAKARSLLRSGRGDWLLLRAGDVWYESFRDWKISGKSAGEPLLISSYGKGERPVLETGHHDGFSSNGVPLKHVALVGLLFHAHTRDPDSPSFVSSTGGGYGLRTQASVDDLLVENCVFDSYLYGISITGTRGQTRHVGVRRNLVVDSYGINGAKSIGLYLAKTSSVLIEGNVFDHNGWNDRLPEAWANVQSHNLYLSENNDDVYVRGNIIANASSHGLQARGGGTIQGNLFVNNPIGLLFGNGRDARPGGVSGDVSGNVFLGTATINGAKRGWALEVGNIKPGGATHVANNLFAHDQIATASAAIVLSTGDGAKDNAAQTVGINDLTLEGNVVYRWNAGLQINNDLVPGAAASPRALNGLLVRNNDFQRLYANRIISQGQEYDAAAERFQGNRYYNPGDSRQWFKKGGATTSWDQWYAKVDKSSARVKVKYNDPERKIETYNAMLGGKPSVGAFLTQARLMARRIWDPRYAATAMVEYMRAGFKVKKIPPTVTATNLSSKNQQPTRSAVFFIFDKDVSASLGVGDLTITDRKTRRKVGTSAMNLTYDAATNTATWTFPKLDGQALKAGEYDVELSGGGGVRDVKGTPLDGNADGVGGDGFAKRIKIKPDA